MTTRSNLMTIQSPIPYDLLVLIMQWLNKEDLKSVCLVNKYFNEIASTALYAENPWTGTCWIDRSKTETTAAPASMALQRRPYLKNCVRALNITASSTEYADSPAMPMLSTVRFKTCLTCQYFWDRRGAFSAAILALHLSPNISEIQIPSKFGNATVPPEIKEFKKLDSVTFWGNWPTRELDALSRYSTTPLLSLDAQFDSDILKTTLNLSKLRTITVRNARAPQYALTAISNLRHLVSFTIYLNTRYSWNATVLQNPCHLPALKSVQIISMALDNPEPQVLGLMLGHITSNSRSLESILINNNKFQLQSYKADSLVQKIITRYRKTLKSLELPLLSTSVATAVRLFNSCPKLAYAHIHCSERHLLQLEDGLPPESNVFKLAITVNANTQINYAHAAAARLFSASPHLQQLSVKSHVDGQKDAIWMRHWQYDEMMGAPIQVITAPQL